MFIKAFKHSRIISLLIASGALFYSPLAINADPAMTFYIDGSEGGEQSARRIVQLKTYFADNNCVINNIILGKGPAPTADADLFFSPLKQTGPDQSRPAQFKKLLNIKTVDDIPLSSSVMVKASTGIKDLKSLDGVRMGFLSADSLIGYQMPKELFKAAGVTHDPAKITFTDTNFAAITLLMHQDIFSSVIATPVAVGWAKTNDLLIVASTEIVETGGIWAKSNIADEKLNSCTKALSQLNRSDRNLKKLLSIFPYWLDGFVL